MSARRANVRGTAAAPKGKTKPSTEPSSSAESTGMPMEELRRRSIKISQSKTSIS